MSNRWIVERQPGLFETVVADYPEPKFDAGVLKFFSKVDGAWTLVIAFAPGQWITVVKKEE